MLLIFSDVVTYLEHTFNIFFTAKLWEYRGLSFYKSVSDFQ